MKNKPTRLIRILSWTAAIAVAVAIFCFSAQNATESSEVSNSLLKQILSLVGIPCSSGQMEQLVELFRGLIRKLAHFAIYALLGFATINAFFQSAKQSKAYIVIAWIAGTFYAVTDEFHQHFVPGRSMQFSDILLDSCGVAFGIVVFFAALSIIRKIIKRRSLS